MLEFISLVLAAGLAYGVFVDAQARGMNAYCWALFVFIIFVIGLPVYLLARQPKLV